MYKIEFTRKASKGYKNLFPKEYKIKINEAMSILQRNPLPYEEYDIKKLEKHTYRIRIGRVRVQYHVIKKDKVILVYKVELRSDSTYKR